MIVALPTFAAYILFFTVFQLDLEWLTLAHTPGSCHHISEFQKLSQWINPSKKHIQPVQHWKHLWTKKKKPTNQASKQTNKQTNKQIKQTNHVQLNSTHDQHPGFCCVATPRTKTLKTPYMRPWKFFVERFPPSFAASFAVWEQQRCWMFRQDWKNAHAEPGRLDDLYTVLKTNMAPENHPSSSPQPSFFGAMLIFGSV